MEKYEFNVVGSELYNFIWSDFCDQYIELAKTNMNNTTKSVLLHTLTCILKMLHPFMPYVTDEIYSMLPIHDESIMISTYPTYEEKYVNEDSKKELDNIIEFVVSVRTYKLEHSIPKDTNVYIEGPDMIARMLKINSENILNSIPEKTDSSVKNELYTIYFDFDNSGNLEKEKEKLEKEKTQLLQNIERREKLLSNENYVAKAPAHLVEQEKSTLEKEKEKLEIILSKLN